LFVFEARDLLRLAVPKTEKSFWLRLEIGAPAASLTDPAARSGDLDLLPGTIAFEKEQIRRPT